MALQININENHGKPAEMDEGRCGLPRQNRILSAAGAALPRGMSLSDYPHGTGSDGDVIQTHIAEAYLTRVGLTLTG